MTGPRLTLSLTCIDRAGAPVLVQGILDTGASGTVAGRSLLNEISHGVTGKARIVSIHGSELAPVHRVILRGCGNDTHIFSATEIADTPCFRIILGANFFNRCALATRRGYFVTHAAEEKITRPPRTHSEALELAAELKAQGRHRGRK